MHDLKRKISSGMALALTLVVLLSTLASAAATQTVPTPDTGSTWGTSTISSPGTVTAGTQATLTATSASISARLAYINTDLGTSYTSGDCHYEWYSSNNAIADVNRSSGRATFGNAGTVTITVYYVAGPQQSGASGSGVWYSPDNLIVAYGTLNVTVGSSSGYGWQGLNHYMKLNNLGSTYITETKRNTDSDGFVNTISAAATLPTDGSGDYEFDLLFSSGFNASNTFASNNVAGTNYMLLDSSNTDVTGTYLTIGTEASVSGNWKVPVIISSLIPADTYTLVFDSGVSGANPGRSLGADVSFIFTVN